MEKEAFEKLFKTAIIDGYVVIKLSNTVIFCADNYSFEYGDKFVSLSWKGFKIGYCKLRSIKYIF